MGTSSMREDITGLISAMIQNHNGVDLSSMLSQSNIFDAAILRAFLLDLAGDEEDFQEFLNETEIDNSFIRGLMAGLVQALLIERGHGEGLGRPSHSEFLAIFDAAAAHLIESSL